MNDLTLYERLTAMAAGTGMAVASTSIAAYLGYFRRLAGAEGTTVSFTDLVAAVVMLFVIKLLVGPATFVVAYSLITGGQLDQAQFLSSPLIQGWLNATVVLQLVLCYGFYLYILRPEIRPTIFGRSKQPGRDIALGVASWLIAYPWVVVASQGVEALVNYLSAMPPIEQEAVQYVRGITAFPVMLVFSFLLVALVIPIIEEIVFRGFLQQWLKQRLSPLIAIAFTSFLFAIAHFSTFQGLSNLSIVSALFVLSLFLGYLRERQGNLLAPISLHAAVNGITLLIILFQENNHEATYSALNSLNGL